MGKGNAPPWAEMAGLGAANRADRGGVGRCWVPAADVLECADRVVIVVELPGISLEDVTVEVRGQDLWVHGTAPGRTEGVVRHHVVERAVGPFARRFALAGLCAGAGESVGGEISAVFRGGLLTVTLLKSRSARRRIPVD
ncbi:Hsp20 family protein [Pseudodesulfovibrio sp. F-1]|uniref:Hsp20 family protein n=1 Tax=Pseudodesulfovibrio alkaliphilus TaxID=2661613 RepID=A0A7K1KM46_9BACT|nr:Hsp20/alpha crystallin family protein [Pseudodesulfovibrio alkaliphilus]MUM77110.1 Hsp20 family protein [Pseudodesulfovibrio alkaliphilus]